MTKENRQMETERDCAHINRKTSAVSMTERNSTIRKERLKRPEIMHGSLSS